MAEESLLLHVCCYSCTLIALEELKTFSKIELFFYAPNIAGKNRFLKQEKDLNILAEERRLKLNIVPQDVREFFSVVLPLETPNSMQYDSDTIRRARKRCSFCYQLLLSTTANFAKENNFSAFSTSLLSSPYQTRSEILLLGRIVEKATGVRFVDFDGRKKAFLGRKKAQSLGFYIPEACGCVYSQKDGEAPRLH